MNVSAWCDLSKDSFEATPDGQSCGNESRNSSDSLWALAWTTGETNSRIRITNTRLDIVLENFNCTLASPFAVRESDVLVRLEGSNVIQATSGAFLCEQGSNLRILGTAEDFLSIESNVTGIGANESCGLLRLAGADFSLNTTTGPALGILAHPGALHRLMPLTSLRRM
jgi:hypothetical protein